MPNVGGMTVAHIISNLYIHIKNTHTYIYIHVYRYIYIYIYIYILTPKHIEQITHHYFFVYHCNVSIESMKALRLITTPDVASNNHTYPLVMSK